MKSAGQLYLKSVHQQFSYLGTWLPNANLHLGDVGVLKGEEFKQMTTLKALGIPFTTRPGANKVDFAYTSKSGVKLLTKLKGDATVTPALPVAEAGVSIQFSEEGAFVFQASGCLVDTIENKTALGQAAITLYQQGRWDADWGVIDTVVKADCTTIVVSNSASSGLELTAKTPTALTQLANLDAGLAVSAQNGDIIRFIAAQYLTPLFQLSRVKKSFLASLLGGAKPITFGGVPAASVARPKPDDVFEAVGPAG